MNKFPEQLRQFRRELHRFPDVSGEEQDTAQRVEKFVEQFSPDETVKCSQSSGFFVVFYGGSPGPTVMIRAELDALPISEINDIPYRSANEGKGHLCGHDGHMTMVAGLASGLSRKRPDTGKVVLMFQPAEEIGQGAARMLDDPAFRQMNPDYIFALHNLPGFPKNEIIIKDGVFASASKGLIITYEGKTSHAAEPENGISPVAAIAQLIQDTQGIAVNTDGLKDFALITVVHVNIGARTFGVSPGTGVVMCTLRAYHDEDLQKLESALRRHVHSLADEYSLTNNIEETEVFHSTINDKGCCNLIRKAAEMHGLNHIEIPKPFRWSEDFGLFTQSCRGAMFGLGAGEKTPDLHNPDYDFPDDITATGILMFSEIINSLLNKVDA